MANVLFFNFDGTNNAPDDAEQELKNSGGIEDAGITNILKFHLLLGGNLKKENTPLPCGSRTFYYNGVGTYGNFFERILNAGLAPEKWDVVRIINLALADFKQYYTDAQEKADIIMVTGFSRGGAIARRFAALINDMVPGKIIIEGIFDTVASIGLPNMSMADRPDYDVVFEDGCSLPKNVKAALHLVALDEKRKAFQPTLMNREKKVKEVWFPGAHADVGGGYYYDGLADNALRFFLDWFESLHLKVPLLSSKTIRYDNLLEPHLNYRIGPDDIQVEPDTTGISHQQERWFAAAALTLGHRRCCVIEKDRVQPDALPLVHWSVADRIFNKRDYRPKSLEKLPHRLLYPDLKEKAFVGVSEHKIKILQDFHIPEDGIETFVFAYRKFNHTRILLEQDCKYEIQVIETGKWKWCDGSIKNLDGRGWNRGDVRLGPKEIPIKVMEPFRRVTGDGVQWFTLCGSIGEDEKTAFSVGNHLAAFEAPISGELCLFANDMDGFYGNNTGRLKVRVTKLSSV